MCLNSVSQRSREIQTEQNSAPSRVRGYRDGAEVMRWLVDAAAPMNTKCDCDSGYLKASGRTRC